MSHLGKKRLFSLDTVPSLANVADGGVDGFKWHYSLLSSTFTVSLCSGSVRFWVTDAFYSMFCFWICTKVVYLQHCVSVTWPVPCETAAVSVHILCTPHNHAPVYSVTSFQATYVGCMCVLTVTCHLHLWQNDQDLLHAPAVTQGWNG